MQIDSLLLSPSCMKVALALLLPLSYIKVTRNTHFWLHLHRSLGPRPSLNPVPLFEPPLVEIGDALSLCPRSNDPKVRPM